MGFLGFAYGALKFVAKEHPDAERIDFITERKKGITHHLVNEIVPDLASVLRQDGRGDLVRLIGKLTPARKESGHCQAADLMLWHLRRSEFGEAKSIDEQGLNMMLDKTRVRCFSHLAKSDVDVVSARLKAKATAAPSPTVVSVPESSSRTAQAETGDAQLPSQEN